MIDPKQIDAGLNAETSNSQAEETVEGDHYQDWLAYEAECDLKTKQTNERFEEEIRLEREAWLYVRE
jgi:hypothetical protein